MSMYTKLKLKFNPKKALTNEEIELIKNNLNNRCGVRDYDNIGENQVEFEFTVNNGLDRIRELLTFLENYIDYEEVTEIGEFSTEQIWKFYHTQVYTYKNKIFIVSYEYEGLYGFSMEHYTISDLRGLSEDYSFTNDELEENIVEKLIKGLVRVTK